MLGIAGSTFLVGLLDQSKSGNQPTVSFKVIKKSRNKFKSKQKEAACETIFKNFYCNNL